MLFTRCPMKIYWQSAPNGQKLPATRSPITARAEVNGKPVSIEKADVGFMAVPVPAGDSEITFTYHTPGLKAGALLSLGGLVLFAGYLTVAGIYNKRHPNPKTESICCVDYSTEETAN